jgi:hypothetical protein
MAVVGQDLSVKPVLSTAIYLLPGMCVQLRIPVIEEKAWFTRDFVSDPMDYSKVFGKTNNASDPLRGFVILNKDVGELIAAPDDVSAVIYKHIRAETNAIWFFARTGEVGKLDIVAVPIHDHGSIVQGGPAYGTYFSDNQE